MMCSLSLHRNWRWGYSYSHRHTSVFRRTTVLYPPGAIHAPTYVVWPRSSIIARGKSGGAFPGSLFRTSIIIIFAPRTIPTRQGGEDDDDADYYSHPPAPPPR